MKNAQQHCFMTVMLCLFNESVAGDPQAIMFPGQMNIALLTDLHETRKTTNSNDTECEIPGIRSLDLATSAVWAVRQANLRRLPEQATLGLYVYDTCGRHDVAQRQLYRLLNHVVPGPPFGCGEQQTSPVFGIISQTKKETTEVLANILEAFSVPLLLTSGASAGFNLNSNVFSTAPSLASLARAVVQTLNFVKVKRLALVQFKDFTQPVRWFQLEAGRYGIQVAMVIHLPTDQVAPWSVNSLKKNLSYDVQAMVFFVHASYVEAITQSKESPVSGNMTWIFATTTEFDFHKNAPGMRFSSRIFFVSPETTSVPKFHLIQHGQKFHAGYVEEKRTSLSINTLYMREGDSGSRKSGGMNHPGSEQLHVTMKNVHEEEKRRAEDSDPGEKMATAHAVWALAEAAWSVQKSAAFWNPGRCLRPEPRTLASDVLNHLPKLNATFDNETLVFGEDKRLASLNYIVMNASDYPRNWTQVGTYSDIKSFMRTPRTTTSITSEDGSATGSVSTEPINESEGERKMLSTAVPETSLNRTKDVKFSTWVKRPWTITVLSVCILGTLLCVYAFVYLLLKMCDGSVKASHHFLSCLHLLTLVGMYCAAAIVTFKRTSFLCILRRMTQNLSYVSCFGCVLLKTLQVKSPASFLGFGSQLSYLSQLLMFCFILGIQVALDVQWATATPTCATSTLQFFISQIYIVVLLAFALLATICALRSTVNIFETHCLVATSVISGIIMGARAAIYYVIRDQQSRDISLSFSLVITAAVTYVGICAPLAYYLQRGDRDFHGSEEDSLSSRARFPRVRGGSSRRSSRTAEIRCYPNEACSGRPSIFTTTMPVFMTTESAQL